jgi:hypothetical protein
MSKVFQLSDNDNAAIDSHFEIESGDIVFHSRGGNTRTNPVNSQYGDGLRLILHRLEAAKIDIDAAWVDSSTVQGIPLKDRKVLGSDDIGIPASDAFTRVSRRMKVVGRGADASPVGGNSTRRLRIRLLGKRSDDELVRLLNGKEVKRDMRSLNRLPADDLARVTSEHIWNAVQNMLGGEHPIGYGPSTEYDVLVGDGSRLPPKEVYGLAASEALGFNVESEHFTAGLGTRCFRAIEGAGLTIVRKDAAAPVEPNIPPDEDWKEGGRKLVQHVKKERAAGLSAAKKAQFKRIHGELFCEKCGMNPLEAYGGPDGEACIEVHHQKTHVSEMSEEHRTKLDDLQCLCANCHRVEHRKLRQPSHKNISKIRSALRH